MNLESIEEDFVNWLNYLKARYPRWTTRRDLEFEDNPTRLSFELNYKETIELGIDDVKKS